MFRRTHVAIAVATSLLIFAGLGAVVWWMRPAPEVRPAKEAAKAKATSDRPKYPYPECERFVAELMKTTGDPSSLSIVEWVSRIQVEESPVFRWGTILITANVRDRNQYGALEVHKVTMPFYDGPTGPTK